MELQTIRNFIEFSMGVKSSLKDRTTALRIKVKAPFNPAVKGQLDMFYVEGCVSERLSSLDKGWEHQYTKGRALLEAWISHRSFRHG